MNLVANLNSQLKFTLTVHKTHVPKECIVKRCIVNPTTHNGVWIFFFSFCFRFFSSLLISPSTTSFRFRSSTDLRRNHRFRLIFIRRSSPSVKLEVDTLDRRCRWLLPLFTSWTSVVTFSSIVSIATMSGKISSSSSLSFSVEIFTDEMKSKWTVSMFLHSQICYDLVFEFGFWRIICAYRKIIENFSIEGCNVMASQFQFSKFFLC